MENKGQISMLKSGEEDKEPIMSVEERNDKLKKLYHQIVGKPQFARGQYVEPSDLGIVTQVLEPGQKAIVTEAVIKDPGVHKGQVEIQTLNEEGRLIRMAVDPRFLKRQNEKENNDE